MRNALSFLLILSVIIISGCTSAPANNQYVNQVETSSQEPDIPACGYPIPLNGGPCLIFLEQIKTNLEKCPTWPESVFYVPESAEYIYDSSAFSLERESLEQSCSTTIFQKLIPKTAGTHELKTIIDGEESVTLIVIE